MANTTNDAQIDSQTEFGAQMVEWREASGLSRKDFARKLNVSLTAVKNWETGHSTPKLTKYSEIAKVLSIDVRDMGLDSNLDFDRVGDRIKYARLLRGMSIEAFSYEFGFAIQTVKSWESHAAEVSEASLDRIARALKIPETFFDMNKDPHEELEAV
ncbi:MAG: helix-turn-helix transcriptional regulator [SAR324 cluster bacterium]|nr:helix-turn-helix transcriptional regulator [SAR324 cluster bacterium]